MSHVLHYRRKHKVLKTETGDETILRSLGLQGMLKHSIFSDLRHQFSLNLVSSFLLTKLLENCLQMSEEQFEYV